MGISLMVALSQLGNGVGGDADTAIAAEAKVTCTLSTTSTPVRTPPFTGIGIL